MKIRLLAGIVAFVWFCTFLAVGEQYDATLAIPIHHSFWLAFGYVAFFLGNLLPITALVGYAIGLWGTK